MVAARLLDRSVFLRELLPQDLTLEIEQLTRPEAMKAARFLPSIVGIAHGRQMDVKARRKWRAEVKRSRSKRLDAPSWLWSSIVGLVARQEAAYLEHCRRYALRPRPSLAEGGGGTNAILPGPVQHPTANVSECARRADGHHEGADHRTGFCDARTVLAEAGRWRPAARQTSSLRPRNMPQSPAEVRIHYLMTGLSVLRKTAIVLLLIRPALPRPCGGRNRYPFRAGLSSRASKLPLRHRKAAPDHHVATRGQG